jgi:hypothetical protein
MPTLDGESIVDLLSRDPLPEDALQERLTETILTQVRRVPSEAARALGAREAIIKHGLARVMDQQSEIDRLTGKRLTPEEG